MLLSSQRSLGHVDVDLGLCGLTLQYAWICPADASELEMMNNPSRVLTPSQTAAVGTGVRRPDCPQLDEYCRTMVFIGACWCKGVVLELMPNVSVVSQKKNTIRKRARLAGLRVGPGVTEAATIRPMDAKPCNGG
jgi:hypothetical protein